jgi:energy-coupling factor transporter ATP-binding protein EcfA2
VVDRIGALARFTAAAQGHLPDRDLAQALALIERTGERLALSREHTVVALAGSTGGGKSSIFNGLAGLTLSPTGLRRPTTGEAHACVWGAGSANGLLDWLGVGRRFTRDGGSDPDLSGLVLLDLPDFDSVQTAHRAEADRLLAVVDLIVWVLHPQKYADKLVHKSYLAQFHRHRDITVVVLNQADLLGAEDLQECLTHLPQLLADDGLGDLPVRTASTVGPPGLHALADALSQAVAARQAALRRLSADLDGVTATLEPFIGQAVPKDALGPATTNALTDALARSAGVPMVATATQRAYVHRAGKHTRWPPLRWLRRLRPDPLSRLHLGEHTTTPAATSIGPAAPAAQAAVALALREAAARAGQSLPQPWQASILAALRSNMDDLPDALDGAVARTDLGLSRPRWWWRAVGGLQWLAAAVALVGLLWLAVRYAMFALALPEPSLPQVGRIPLPTALLGGGLLAGLLISILVRPVVQLAARHQRRRAHARLRSGIERVAQDLVVTPAERVLGAYTQARDSLRQARG